MVFLLCAYFQAKDSDLGLNGEVRYQILGRADEESRRFAIDPVTGQVRAISRFSRDAGKVFGFDVKATDRRGADDGKSAIANVFVRTTNNCLFKIKTCLPRLHSTGLRPG